MRFAENETKKSMLAFWLLLFQAVMVVGIAIYIAVASQRESELLSRAAVEQARLNREVISEIQRDVGIHAEGSALRNCAIAEELEFLVNESPEVSDRVLARVAEFTRDACRVIPIGPTPNH